MECKAVHFQKKIQPHSYYLSLWSAWRWRRGDGREGGFMWVDNRLFCAILLEGEERMGELKLIRIKRNKGGEEEEGGKGRESLMEGRRGH